MLGTQRSAVAPSEPLSGARHGQVNAQTDGRTGAAGGRPAGFLTPGKALRSRPFRWHLTKKLGVES